MCEVEVDMFFIGLIIVVRLGDCIVVDGVIVDGVSVIDEVLVIGESVLVCKERDVVVFVGMINGEVVFKVCVIVVVVDNMIVCVVKLVEEV